MQSSIYEYLYQLHRTLQEAVEILERIGKSPGMNKNKFRAYQIEVELLRSEAAQDIAEVMDAIEGKEAHRLWMQKKAYEDSIGDPDDVYFAVMQREEERRRKGLPSRLHIEHGQLALVEEEDGSNGKQKKTRRKMGGPKGKSLRRPTTKR
jgi:hypothetical protein